MNHSIIILITLVLFLSACNRPISKPISKTKGQSEIIVPAGCLDQTGKFIAIRSISTRLSYNDKPSKYQPIRNTQGFISHDFNKDNKNDFLFIERNVERNKTLIKLVSCISQGKQYQRRQTPFIIHEEKNADFQTISESIKLHNNLLFLSTNKHEHNWGSDNETKIYRFDVNRNDFILVKQTIFSSSGDGMRSDTEEVYNLDSKRFRQKQTCGFSEEGCISPKKQTKTGRIILPKKRASLSKGGKVYERLIAD